MRNSSQHKATWATSPMGCLPMVRLLVRHSTLYKQICLRGMRISAARYAAMLCVPMAAIFGELALSYLASYTSDERSAFAERFFNISQNDYTLSAVSKLTVESITIVKSGSKRNIMIGHWMTLAHDSYIKRPCLHYTLFSLNIFQFIIN